MVNKEEIKKLLDIFDSIICVIAEGPEVMRPLEIYKKVGKDAGEGYNIVKKYLQDPLPKATGEVYTTKRKRKLTGKRLETFNKFWAAFNYKDGKADAADAWLDIPELTDALVKTIIASAKIECKNRQAMLDKGKTPKMAQGWINSRRWEDEHKTSPPRDGARSLPEFKPPVPEEPDPNHKEKLRLTLMRVGGKITQAELEKRMEELDKNC